jgi:peptidoglycan/LPS O-acetylase OafA/YrhL
MSRWEMASALTYTRNFYSDGGWHSGHAWSLAIEEQFYLFWPLLLSRLDVRKATRFAGAVVLLGPFVRLATYFVLPQRRDMIDWYTFTRIDSIMFGCLLALVRNDEAFVRVSRRFYAYGGAVACLAAVIASAYMRAAFTWWDVVCSYSVEGASVALLIQWCVTHETTAFGRFLELRPMRVVGDMSYSLYLWQQLFLNRHSDFVLCRFPLNIVCVVATAYVSRHLIENPFLRLKSRFSSHDAKPVVHGAAVDGRLAT